MLEDAAGIRRVILACGTVDLRKGIDGLATIIRYNGDRHKTEIGATKRKKIRTVDFCDTLAAILKATKTEQHKNRFRYGELYNLNYYLEVKEKDRTYYEVYSLPRTEEVLDGYKEISFECPKCKHQMEFLELYHKHKPISLNELYERTMAKYHCRSSGKYA